MRISDDGLAFLIREEGSVPYAYNDPAGHATFGVGHLIHHGHVTDADRSKWGTKAHPRLDLVVATLRDDIGSFERHVTQAVRVALSQNEFDALVSLAFNIGTGGFDGSSVLRLLNLGNRQGAADAFLKWSMAGGKPILRGRRERERKLFLEHETAADWLREDELRWVREFDSLDRQSVLTAQETRRRGVLVRVMTARRKSIWREAQKTGWDVNDRQRRYKSLKARTT